MNTVVDQYELVQPSLDITKRDNLVLLGKFYLISIAVSIVTLVVLILITDIIGNNITSNVIKFFVILSSQLLVVTLVQNYSGCYTKK